MIVREIDGPHLLLQAAPEACWRAIVDFLGESKPGAEKPGCH